MAKANIPYDEWAKSYTEMWDQQNRLSQDQGFGTPEGGSFGFAPTGLRDPVAELRRTQGLPASMTDQQIIDQFRASGIQRGTDGGLAELLPALAVAAPFLGGVSGLFGAGAGAGAGTGAGLSAELAAGAPTAGAGAAAGAMPSFANVIGGASTTAPAAAPIVGGSALGRILGLGQTGQDILNVGGQVLPGLIGAIGANRRTNALEDLANKQWGAGEPYRAQALNYLNNPEAYLQGPLAQELSRQTAQTLSQRLGNPAGSPYGQTLMNQSMAGNYWNAMNNLGNLGGQQSIASGAPGASQNAIGSQAGVYGGIGDILGNVLNPPKPTIDWTKIFSGVYGAQV